VSSDPLHDQGAQAERTALAWRRTGLTALALGALLLHGFPSAPAYGAVVIIFGAISAMIIARVRYSYILRALREERTPAAPAATAVAAVAAAACAVLVVAALATSAP
jgi:uncharacterized membrane protein YidH (DUF202 family)